jgi:hypothetical protein
MLLKTRTILDDLATGETFHFMGANVEQRTFRLMNEQGENFVIRCVVPADVEGERPKPKQRYTEFVRLGDDEEVPRGCRGDKSFGPVRVFQYDKEDTSRGIRATSNKLIINIGGPEQSNAPSVATLAIWNKGYRLVDVRSGGGGHTWLWIGHHNYKSIKGCRAVFLYNAIEDYDDEETNDEEV